jgi:dUTP pyrophosphatase
MILKYLKGGKMKQALEGDAGFDIYSNEDCFIDSLDQKWVSTGLFVEIPSGFVGVVKEKSGLAGKGVMLGAGIIDSNYRGEVKVLVRNFSKQALKIEKDQKIAQFLFVKVEIPKIQETEKLSETERGAGGFGSTGLK